MRFLKTFLRNTNGAAAAEMALMVPLLTVILFASFEGGYYLWSEHKVLKGVRDGARYAGRQSFNDVDCAGNTFSDTAVIGAIQNLTRSGFTDGDNPDLTGADNPVVPGWAAADVTIVVTCDSAMTTGIYRDQEDGAPRVTVSASVDYPSLFGTLGFPSTGLTLNGQAEAAVMGI